LTPATKGADTLFFEAALAVGVPVKMIQPFSNYDQDFLDLESQEFPHEWNVSDKRKNQLIQLTKQVLAAARSIEDEPKVLKTGSSPNRVGTLQFPAFSG
jgi:hypothetical protein